MANVSKANLKGSLKDKLKLLADSTEILTSPKNLLDKIYFQNGSCFYFSTAPKSWANANDFCLHLGPNNYSSLYVLKDQLEYEYLINKTVTRMNNMTVNEKAFYLGLRNLKISEQNNGNNADIYWSTNYFTTHVYQTVISFKYMVSKL